MKAIATICSRRKQEDSSLLSAQERYTGDHVNTVGNIARDSNLLFFILSGKYGLIPADQPIPYYDFYLENEHVEALTHLVSKQLQEAGITALNFYTEDKESWAPYITTISKGAELVEVALKLRRL